MQNLIKFQQFIQKIVSGNDILITTKGHNHVVNSRELTCNNLNVDLVKGNACAKFGLFPSIRPQDIERT